LKNKKDFVILVSLFDTKKSSLQSTMNAKQRKTLATIFTTPLRSDVLWSDIESLFRTLGGEVSEGSGSRVRVVLNGVRAVFHRPHPKRETDKGTLKSVHRFLLAAGISSEETNASL
jgi:HicA toxin of bacterial toxin-antitoxin,